MAYARRMNVVFFGAAFVFIAAIVMGIV